MYFTITQTYKFEGGAHLDFTDIIVQTALSTPNFLPDVCTDGY